MRVYDWAAARAADFFSRAPKFRTKDTLSHEIQQAFFAGLKAASDYHARQAATMRGVLEDIERGTITSADPVATRQWVSHHEHCANAVELLDPA